ILKWFEYIDRKKFTGCKDIPGSEKRKPTQDKESIRWLDVLNDSHNLLGNGVEAIHVADREGDIYELYREACVLDEKFIIRAKSNRVINKNKKREPVKERLFDYLEKQPTQGTLKVEVQINGKKKTRIAKLSIIFAKITIPPPNRTVHPPKNCTPIKWVLMSNLTTSTVDEAIQYVTWYSYRWNVEVFHKILKSGCSVEKTQLRNASRQKKYITLKSIIAWRLFWLTRTFERARIVL
ncbi:MAG: IS4 family transposase, partial [Proteobacteria bacterium]|nr:IS4 family transposase [Pseudomonadota bacterium]